MGSQKMLIKRPIIRFHSCGGSQHPCYTCNIFLCEYRGLGNCDDLYTEDILWILDSSFSHNLIHVFRFSNLCCTTFREFDHSIEHPDEQIDDK